MRLLTYALAALLGAAPHPSSKISWADAQHRHGWTVVKPGEAGRWCPTAYHSPRLCSTDDGGRTWKPILFVDHFGRTVFDRTSAKAGLLVLYRDKKVIAISTVDGGDHWFAALLLESQPPVRIWGKGAHVLWKTKNGTIRRLVGWPPIPGTCGFEWLAGIGDAGPRRNVCGDPDYGPQPPSLDYLRSEVVKRGRPKTSWSDASHRHGWAQEQHSGRPLCAAGKRLFEIRHYRMSALCATEDGGRTFHPIFYTAKTRIMGFVRTSRSSGWVVAGFRAQEWYWTVDNGKHWNDASFLGPPGFPFFRGFLRNQPALYFVSSTGLPYYGPTYSAVFRLTNSAATEMRTQDFDPEAGLGFMRDGEARLAADWTAAEVQERARGVTVQADLESIWDVTCASDDGTASSTSQAWGVRHVLVKSAAVRDSTTGRVSGLRLDGYDHVISDDGSVTPAPVGADCPVLHGGVYLPGSVTARALESRSATWLLLVDSNPPTRYPAGRYAYPAVIPAP